MVDRSFVDGREFKPEFTMQTHAEIVARMKSEIQQDIADGRVPSDVSSFERLHDYVDANLYGGAESLLDECGGSASDQFCAIINAAQDEIDTWLADGQPSDDEPLDREFGKRI